MSSKEIKIRQGEIKKNWNGFWIWVDGSKKDRNAYGLFRKGFQCLDDAVLNIDITANNHYTLLIDGEFVSRGPVRSHPEFFSFDSHKITIGAGSHCIGIIIHHVGEPNATMIEGRPGFIADIILDDKKRIQDLSTNETWECNVPEAWIKDLPCLMSHYGFWEDVDMRKYPLGWDKAGYKKYWMNSYVIGKAGCLPWENLVRREIPAFVYARTDPVSLIANGTWWDNAIYGTVPFEELKLSGEMGKGKSDYEIPSESVNSRIRKAKAQSGTLFSSLRFGPSVIGEGSYLTFDFGKTISGYVVIKFKKAYDGQRIDIAYDEIIDVNGSLNPERSYVHFADRFTLSDDTRMIRTLHPRGFRYIMLDIDNGSKDIEIEDFYVIKEEYPYEDDTDLCFDDPGLNSFVNKSLNTIKACTIDCFTDNPTRERVQWTGEAHYISQICAMIGFNDHLMSRRMLYQAAQGILPDGRINGFIPTERTNCSEPHRSILWLNALIDYWLYFGIEEDIRELMPCVLRVLEAFDVYSDKNLLISSWPVDNWWDWAEIEREGCTMITNAFYAYTLKRLASAAVFQDNIDTDLTKKSQIISDNAHKLFWSEEMGIYRDAFLADNNPSPVFSQYANIAAIISGICPEMNKRSVMKRIFDSSLVALPGRGEALLRDRNAQRGIVPVSTPWFDYWAAIAYFKCGLDVEAVNYIKEAFGMFEKYPTFPEVKIQHGNTNLCQSASAGVLHLLSGYVLGVNPESGGWEKAGFRPFPGEIKSASGTFKTPYGLLKTGWKRDDDGYIIDVSKPKGIELEIAVFDDIRILDKAQDEVTLKFK